MPTTNQSLIALSPAGRLICQAADGPLAKAFTDNECTGLFALLERKSSDLTVDDSTTYWREVVNSFIRLLCHVPEGTGGDFEITTPDTSQLTDWVLNAPPMSGAEYLSPGNLLSIWQRLEAWTQEQVATLGGIAAFLHRYAPNWSRVGRVTVHLAENKGDADYPFAFMATYASGLNAAGRLRQLPLGKALQEYSGSGDKAVLLKLLEPLHRASQSCPFMGELVESGDVFHPLAWTPQEAHTFLQSIPAYEDAGLLVRLPNWWQKRSRRPKVNATIGDKKKGKVGLDALLDFKLEVVIDGQTLTPEEVAEMLAGEEGLVLFRGQWIEVDRNKLQQALDHWKALEAEGGVSFAEGMRLLAGASENLAEADEAEDERKWAFAQPGDWLADALRQLTDPAADSAPPSGLQANLRPYQHKGLDWLWFCARTGLGACLADDMGLGKTIQVLAALQRKKETDPAGPPALLIVPASLIGNWQHEATRFTPDLRLFIAHRSKGDAAFEDPSPKILDKVDLLITTYGMLTRLTWPVQGDWSWIIIDEAQAIKNHGTRQSKAVRKLRAQARIALTGTPVENHLGDLWSLFDFINPGLLGSQRQFADFAKNLPRGRAYLRNGSVLHLGIEPGKIRALVMGSELYEQTVRIDPLPKAKWDALKKRCQGKIGSLVELLQGKLSGEIMAIVTDRKDGLFPGPREIKMDCNCPDWAGLCKHLAAVLYGVGARLDDAPELLFKLRGVDHTELIQTDTAALVEAGAQGGRRRLAPAALGDVFGIEMDDEMEADAPPTVPVPAPLKKKTARKPLARKTVKRPKPKKRAAKKAATHRKRPTRQTTKRAKGTKTTPKSQPFRATGSTVIRLRDQLGLSRTAFARQLGVSGPTIANWESQTGKLSLQRRSLSALRRLHRSVQGK